MNTPVEHILECNLEFAPNLLSQQTFIFRRYALIFNHNMETSNSSISFVIDDYIKA